MPDDHDALLANLKFGIGQPVPRKEDPKLVTGRGRFTDDVDVPGQVFAHPLRSHNAHGILRHLDVGAALAASGVLAVYTAADMTRAGYGPLRCKLPLKSADGSALIAPPRPILADGRVRYVGEILAVVIAETRHAAQEAAERIVVEIEPLPVVTDPEAAGRDDAPRLYDDHGNVCLDWRFGDEAATERALAAAAHVTRLRMVNNRVVVAAMEPRAALAQYEPESGRFTLRVGCQGVFGLRQAIAQDILRIEPERVHVVADQVGGSFGMKSAVYPEYIACLHAARELGRPVKWRDDRHESFLSDQHGRAAIAEGELALDAEGNFLAVRMRCIGDMGAYLSNFGPVPPTVNIQKNLPSLYRTPCMAISTRCVFTNTTPTGPYRGAGRPEANYYMERLIDAAARETGRDPAALRRQNMIPADAIPYTAVSGLEYDSGDFAAVLDACLDKADWQGFEERRAASTQQGLLRGRGLACYLEATAPRRQGDGWDPLRGGRAGHGDHRHVRLRPRPCVGVRPGARRPAGRAVRADRPGAGRQRPAADRRRHGRLTLDHGERQGDRRRVCRGRSRRAARSPAISSRRPRSISCSATAAFGSLAPTARSPSWSLPQGRAQRPACRAICRRAWTSR